jgi:hypothetical protein
VFQPILWATSLALLLFGTVSGISDVLALQ